MKQHRRAAVNPPKPEEEEEDKEEQAERPRKGHARRRRKATAAPALPEPEVPLSVRRSRRTSARRGKGETGSPCGFGAQVGAVGELRGLRGAKRQERSPWGRARYPLAL